MNTLKSKDLCQQLIEQLWDKAGLESKEYTVRVVLCGLYANGVDTMHIHDL